MSEPNAIRTAVPVHDSQDTHRFSRASSELEILRMEGIHGNVVRVLRDAGFKKVETHATALSEDAPIERLCDAHCLGIRSRTRVTARVLEAATELRSIGCFRA